MKFKKPITTLCLLFLTIGIAAQSHELSVKEAIEYAQKNNQQIKNALLDVKIQLQTNREVSSAALPQVNGNVSSNYYPNIPVQRFPNFIAAATYGVLTHEGVKDGNGNPIVAPNDFGYIQAGFGSKFTTNAGVSFQQLLFDGQVFVGLQARRTAIEFQQKNVEVTEEVIKANIYKVYYQLAASKYQVNIINSNIARLEKLANDTRIMYKNGFAEKIDVDKVSVQLSNLQTEKEKVLNTIENGYYGLKLLMGMPIQDSLILKDTISHDEITNGILDATTYKYQDRKEFQYAELSRRLNQFNMRRYRLSYVPTVALSATHSYVAQGNTLNYLKTKWNPITVIGLNISIPIFDGFAKDARIKRAQLQVKQTDNRIEELKLSIDREVHQAINNYTSALATLDNQKRNMELAEKVYQQTTRKYQAGTGSSIEMQSANSDLAIAQSNYIAAMYDAIIAKIDFLKATGKLD
ncbi:MAG: TolC family protein [Chitinophagaceae bacterium]|nr:TolC family protein [Chitinophagaceae bacterium]